MIALSVKVDFKDVQRKLDALAETTRNRVIPMALNRTADKARAEMTRRITAEYNIKAGEARSQLRIRKSSRKLGVYDVELEAFGRRRGHLSRNVMLFKAKATKPTGYKVVKAKIKGQWRTIRVPVGGGVSVEIKRGSRKVIAGAFIANKGRTVFIRTESDRLPIEGVETIDVPSMFNKRTINAAVLNKIKQDMPVEFDRAIKAVLARVLT